MKMTLGKTGKVRVSLFAIFRDYWDKVVRDVYVIETLNYDCAELRVAVQHRLKDAVLRFAVLVLNKIQGRPLTSIIQAPFVAETFTCLATNKNRSKMSCYCL